jgi:glycosyltransferase involved in cell wall biosynthesis
MSAGSPGIDVVIPVYQAEATLERCLLSLMSQSRGLWKAYVVDDGSSDRSVEIAEKLAGADGRICLLRGEHRGPSAARNAALRKRGGEYVVFLDADDWFEDDALRVFADAAIKYGADVAHCGNSLDYEGGGRIPAKGLFPDDTVIEARDFPAKIFSLMMSGINMNHIWGKIYKASVLEGVYFREDMVSAEDLVFNMEVFSRAKRYVYKTYPAYHYYRGGAGLTGAGLSLKTRWEANVTAAKIMEKHLPEWGMNGIRWRAAVKLRPYRLLLPKAFRAVRDKIAKRR